MTAADRDMVRRARDTARRERLLRSGDPDMEGLWGRFETLDRPFFRGIFDPCVYCGVPAYGELTCVAHRDLADLDVLAAV